MKPITALSVLSVLANVVAAGIEFAQDYLDEINASWFPFSEKGQQDDQILALFSHNFKMMESDERMTGCDKCKSRLASGKILALTRPDLVPLVFYEWCMRKGYGEVGCRSNFGVKDMGSTHEEEGHPTSDFANLLQLMQPFDLDGDWFCYFHDDQCDVEPPVPDISSIMKSWYPQKPYEKFFPPQSSLFDTFHVLQLSDLDYQVDYHIGAEANCSQEICCISCAFNDKSLPKDWDYDGLPVSEKYLTSYYNSSYDADGNLIKGPFVDVFLPTYKGTWQPATTFGTYHCGTPTIMVENVLKASSRLHLDPNIDYEFLYVLLSGGIQVRSNNFQETIESEVSVLKLLKKYFDYIPVVTTLGEHDTYPDAQMAQYKSGRSKEFSWNEELYGDLLLKNGWIDNEIFRTIKTHNGAYSIVTEYGLKIISLNSNFYNADNYYCFWNVTEIDSFGQIEFLVKELIESEQNDQRVWIMSSLPLSSPKLLPLQLKILSNVIERFSPGTIAEIFFGDRHQDGYNILYDSENEERAVSGAWIAPSVSPLHGNNPGFRTYEIDSKTFSVVNAYTYYTPLQMTYRNSGDEPEWHLLYDTRYTYTHELGGDSYWPEYAPLNATFWDLMAREQIRDKMSYKQLYQTNKFKLSEYGVDCSTEKDYTQCEMSFCEIVSFTFEEFKYCIEERYPQLVARKGK